MKKNIYIFLNHDLGGVGGGQRYVFNKSKWLMNQGWRVYAFHAGHEAPMLDYPIDDVTSVLELRAYPKHLGIRKTNKALHAMLSCLPKTDSCNYFIESSSTVFLPWGELLSQELKCCHFVFHIEEVVRPISRIEKEFLTHKLIKHELAVIKPGIAKKMVGSCFSESYDFEKHKLTAHVGSPYADIPFDHKFESSDYVIGMVSRLEKPYIRKMMPSIEKFCLKHPDKTILLVVVGGSPNKSDVAFVANYTSVKNLKIEMFGYMTVIPRKLLYRFDLFIGKAGAASATFREGILTATYSLENDKFLGLIGYDVPSSGASEGYPKKKLEDTLESVFERREYASKPYSYEASCYEERFDEHFDYVNRGQKQLSDMNFNPYLVSGCISRRLVSYWIRAFHNTYYEKLLSLMKRHGNNG